MPDKDTQWPEVVLFRHEAKTRPKSIAQKHVVADGEKFERYLPISSIRAALLSDEAVEAAARAPFDHHGSDEYWDVLEDMERVAIREDARLILEAALNRAFPDTNGEHR